MGLNLTRTRGMSLVALTVGMLAMSSCAASTDPPTPRDDALLETSVTTPAPVDVLPECEGFLLDENEQVAADIVAACLSGTMVVHNFGKMTVSSDELSGVTSFRFRPDFAATVALDGDPLLFIDGDAMWMKDQLGWVQAIENSTEPRSMIAYTTASAFKTLSDPHAAIALIEAAGTWTIVGEEEVETVDGNNRSGWHLSATPFDFAGVHIDELSFWITSDYTTLKQYGVSSAMGETAVSEHLYYDWGVEEKFTAPNAE